MPRKPYLSREKSRHGRFVWYFKRNGKRVRLPEDYGSAEFNAAYDAAFSGTSIEVASGGKPKAGTLRWLAGQYKRSAKFAALSPATRRQRDNILKHVIDLSGDKPFAAITRVHIRKAMDKRAATPHAANNFLKTMSGLFRWALESDLVKINPVIGIGKASFKSDGFHSWSVDEVEQYRARHPVGTKPRLAIDLLLFLGLRRSDVVLVGRQHVKDGLVSLRTQKTGGWVYLPIFQQLRQSIEATPIGDMAFLTTQTGKPFSTGASFGNWFRDRCNEAGLPSHCRAHGLRKAGATIAANEGASGHELMAMYGWSRLSMAEIYTKAADRKKLAYAASERLANKL